MREHHVLCGGLEAGRNKSDVLHIDVNAPAGSLGRVNLHIDQLSKRLDYF